MRLIEKGLSPEEVKSYFAGAERKPRGPSGALKWGILLLFFGAGLFVANVLEQIMDFSDGITFGVVLLFIGAGFLTYYMLARGRETGKSDNTKISNN